MSDEALAPTAETPVEQAPAEEVLTAPNPIKTEPAAEPKAEKPEPKASAREALDKAAAKVEKAEKTEPEKTAKPVESKAADKPQEKPVADPKQPQRDPTGKFASTEPKTDAADAEHKAADHRVAPKRFTAEARGAWEALGPEHDHLKAETHRALRELEGGLEKHKPASQRYSEVFQEFDDLARTSNVDPKETIRGYIRFDQGLNKPETFMATMDNLLKLKGVDVVKYAQAVLNRAGVQQPRQVNSETPQAQPQRQGPSPEVTELRSTVARLEQQLGRVGQHINQQMSTENERILSDWAADKPHFQDLRQDIVRLIQQDGLLPDDAYASALNSAREKARSYLGEAEIISRSKPTTVPAEDLEAQTQKGQLSITGAPSAGSSPAARKPSSSIDEAIRRAMSAAA